MLKESKPFLTFIGLVGKLIGPTEEEMRLMRLQQQTEEMRRASIVAQLQDRPISDIEADLLGRF